MADLPETIEQAVRDVLIDRANATGRVITDVEFSQGVNLAFAAFPHLREFPTLLMVVAAGVAEGVEIERQRVRQTIADGREGVDLTAAVTQGEGFERAAARAVALAIAEEAGAKARVVPLKK